MIKYLFKRILYMIIALWVIVTITFFLMNTLPGDPVRTIMWKAPIEFKKAMIHMYGLDKPVLERYVIYMGQLLHGNLGESIVLLDKKANVMIAERFPISARLGLQSIFVGFVGGTLLGILAALKKGTWLEYLVNIISVIGMSVPVYVVAALLLRALVGTPLLADSPWYPGTIPLSQELRYTFVPAIVLSFTGLGTYAKFMRASVLEVINQDYIMTAKSKGLTNRAVMWKHVMRNAILPIVTILGMQTAGVITGSFVIEMMFRIPGLGQYYIYSVSSRDYTMITALTIFFAFIFVVCQVIVDFLYAAIDPRIRITGEER